MERKRKKRGHLTVKQIIFILVFGFVITIASSLIGYIEFTNNIKSIYSSETSQIASYIETDLNVNQLENQFNELISEYINSDISIYRNELIQKPEYQQISKLLVTLREKFDCTGITILDIDDSINEKYLKSKDIREYKDYETLKKGINTGQIELGICYNYSFNAELNNSLGKKSVGPGLILDFADEDLEAVRKVYETGNAVNNFHSSIDIDEEDGNQKSYRTITTFYPIKNDHGDIIAIINIDKPIELLNSARIRYVSLVGIYSFIITVIAIIIFIYINRHLFTKPIQKITRDTRNFVSNNNQISNILKEIKTNDEIQDLAESILKLEKDINTYIKNLEIVTTERERVRAELDLATKIQKSTLPQKFPAFSDRDEFDIYALMNPAREVGGDFYNFYLIDEDHLGVVIGDVSGKGIPAALFMMIGNILIKAHALPEVKVNEIFEKVNDILSTNNEELQFITSWFGSYQISTGEITFVNAGHEPPLILHENGSYDFLETKPNLVLGYYEGIPYKLYTKKLKKGDKFFLYTDGVVEAQNESEELYGQERFVDIIKENKNKNLKEIIKSVRKDIDRFEGKTEQFDDITILGLEIKNDIF